jgi:alkaline phosphatase D
VDLTWLAPLLDRHDADGSQLGIRGARAALGRLALRLLAPLLLGMCLAVAPAANGQEAPLTRVAFGSCANQQSPQPIWDAVLAYRPELFIFAGDNVYGDTPSGDLGPLREAYRRAESVAGYMRLRRSVPTLAIWDDHDFGRNDGGNDYPGRDGAKSLFLDFWNVGPDDPRRSHGGLYSAYHYGPEGKRVQVILLDTRYFRSPLRRSDRAGAGPHVPDDGASRTMLGQEQWAWLEERLREPADLRLIVSSVQVLAEGHSFEHWGNFPRERQRLFDLIGATGAAGVVLLSGDRHVAGIYRTSDAVPYALTELTSSGLSETWPDPTDAQGNRIGALYGAENFGTVDIDWWAGEVRLAARAMNGEPMRSITIPLSDLRPRD